MDIQITLYDLQGKRGAVTLPDDVPIYRFMPALVGKMNLPTIDADDTQLLYYLRHDTTGEPLDETLTLAAAGLGHGAVLWLQVFDTNEAVFEEVDVQAELAQYHRRRWQPRQPTGCVTRGFLVIGLSLFLGSGLLLLMTVNTDFQTAVSPTSMLPTQDLSTYTTLVQATPTSRPVTPLPTLSTETRTSLGINARLDVRPLASDLFAYPRHLIEMGGRLFFTAVTPQNSWELWYLAENGVDFIQVTQFNVSETAPLDNLVVVGDQLFFTADDGQHGWELWVSDGSAQGTRLVKDIYLGPEDAFPTHLANVNGHLFFAASTELVGKELWRSDGTEAGTTLVKDINLGKLSSSLNELINGAGLLYFVADDGLHGQELWRSDGTSAGTVMVADINPEADASRPYDLIYINDTLFFIADAASYARELWAYRGGRAYLVRDIGVTAWHRPDNLVALNQLLYFTADGREEQPGNELWRSNGTAAGTRMVKAISDPLYLVPIGETLFFSADGEGHGRELWRSDGTFEGTFLVKDIAPAGHSDPFFLTDVNGVLFFTALAPEYGRELWHSDGTTAGTYLVADIYPGARGSEIGYMTVVGEQLFFTAVDGLGESTLWMLTP